MHPTPAARHLRHALAQAVHQGRTARGWTQAELARRASVSSGMVALVERGAVNASVNLAGRLVGAVGVTLDLRYHVPFSGARQRDRVHAWCSAYAHRRLTREGWLVLREVELGEGSVRGWIDLLAWHPDRKILLVVEVKTELRDIGGIERTLGWYGREARAIARAHGWQPRNVSRWLLVLATAENDRRISENAAALALAFPCRAAAMREADEAVSGLALIDPAARRRRWLVPTWVDGRRSAPPYVAYRDAATRVAR